MKKKLLYGLLILLALFALLPLALHNWLPGAIEPFLQKKLSELGCSDPKLSKPEISTNAVKIAELVCMLPQRGEFRLEQIELAYSLSKIYLGNFGKVSIRKVSANFFPASEIETKPLVLPLPASFFLFAPISDLEISQIEMQYPWGKKNFAKVNGSLKVRFYALTIEGNLQAKAADPEMDMNFDFVLSDKLAELLIKSGKFSIPSIRAKLSPGAKLALTRSEKSLDLAMAEELLIHVENKKLKQDLRLGAIKAKLSEKNINSEFQFTVAPELPILPVAIDWNLEKESLAFQSEAAALSLEKILPLALEFSGKKKLPLKIEAGEISASVKGELGAGKEFSIHSMEMKGELKNVSGVYSENRFEKLQLPLHFSYRGGALAAEEAVLSMESFDAGFPITKIKANISADGKNGILMFRASGIQANAFAGTLVIPEMVVSSRNWASKFLVQLNGLNLAEMIALQKQEGISGTGLIDGTLPFEMGKKGIEVNQGELRARPPGGLISYQAGEGLEAAAGSNAGLKLAVDVLKNFHYEVLEGTVDYQTTGDMAIAVRVEGQNPDWQGGHPVHFNFTISENILALLKSLRIAERTENVLEEHMRGQ